MAPVTKELPLIDFAPFYQDDGPAKQKLVGEVRDACQNNGFFQIVGHHITPELCDTMMSCSKSFFDMPAEDKMKISIQTNTWNRGYDPMKSQMLEVNTSPELKEGFYIGREVSKEDPQFKEGKFLCGPNIWPDTVPDAEVFRATAETYYRAQCDLAKDVLRLLAKTLDLDDEYFKAFTTEAMATMRLLHYPPQPPDADEDKARGIGAHTDFGCITLLLQGEVDGLQVLDQTTKQWIDVKPVRNAFVVNLGNVMMRWANDRYISNIHRVINKSGRERYSIVLFYGGNPDHVISCLPNCEDKERGAKYAPITTQDLIKSFFVDSYGRAAKYKEEALATPQPVA